MFIWSILQDYPLKLDKQINIGTTQHTQNYKGIFLKHSSAAIHFHLDIDVLISQMTETQTMWLRRIVCAARVNIFYSEIFRLALAHFQETWPVADVIINGNLHSAAGWWSSRMWHDDAEMVSPDLIRTSCKARAYASGFKLWFWSKSTRAAGGILPLRWVSPWAAAAWCSTSPPAIPPSPADWGCRCRGWRGDLVPQPGQRWWGWGPAAARRTPGWWMARGQRSRPPRSTMGKERRGGAYRKPYSKHFLFLSGCFCLSHTHTHAVLWSSLLCATQGARRALPAC